MSTCCAGDKLIVLAEDDNTYAPAEQLPEISDELDGNPEWKARIKKERVLFVGWRRDMHDMIAVLDQFVTKGSELYLYNEVCGAHNTCSLLQLCAGPVGRRLPNITKPSLLHFHLTCVSCTGKFSTWCTCFEPK